MPPPEERMQTLSLCLQAGSTPPTRTLQLSPITGREECHATAEKIQRRVQARERVHRRRYLTLAEARADVFDYIERFHNPIIQRRLDAKDQALDS